jgi:hypothetical protein
MKLNKKKHIKEKELEKEDLKDLNFERHELTRVYAVGLTFTDVSFKQSVIHECYFRNCVFKNCDFTGANISHTNFQGADFIGCTFNYANFQSTLIGIDPLSKNLPGWENTKLMLAKNLRMNYASIGDYNGVNFAIKVELEATMEHLKKAAFSREAYYRGKTEYSGFGRILYILKFVWFWFLDKLWGNGEKPIRMLVSIPLLLFLIVFIFNVVLGQSFGASVKETSTVFFIGGTSNVLGIYASSVISVLRYIVMGLFVSVLVRRLSRR